MPPPDRLDAERRRATLRTVARISVTTVGLLTLYALAPIADGRSALGVVLAVAGGFGLLLAVILHQVGRIRGAALPMLAAAEGVAVAIPFLLLAFSYAYLCMSAADAATFSEPLTRIDAVYFAATTLSTVGFGDITAASQPARLVVTLNIVVNLALAATTIRLLFAIARETRDERG